MCAKCTHRPKRVSNLLQFILEGFLLPKARSPCWWLYDCLLVFLVWNARIRLKRFCIIRDPRRSIHCCTGISWFNIINLQENCIFTLFLLNLLTWLPLYYGHFVWLPAFVTTYTVTPTDFIWENLITIFKFGWFGLLKHRGVCIYWIAAAIILAYFIVGYAKRTSCLTYLLVATLLVFLNEVVNWWCWHLLTTLAFVHT